MPSVSLSTDEAILFLSLRDERTYVLRTSGMEERQQWCNAIEAAAFNPLGRSDMFVPDTARLGPETRARTTSRTQRDLESRTSNGFDDVRGDGFLRHPAPEHPSSFPVTVANATKHMLRCLHADVSAGPYRRSMYQPRHRPPPHHEDSGSLTRGLP